MGVYLFPFTSATKLHFFLGVFLHFITGADIAISVSLAITGEPLNSATAIVTPAAVGDLFNVHVEAIIDVPKGCCLTIALENTSTQAITAQNVNVIIDRVA